MIRLRLTGEQIKNGRLTDLEKERLHSARAELKNMLPWFRGVTDRKLTSKLMRSHIDFLCHETNSDYTLVVIDNLHKLLFKDFSERRTGIDAWLRQLEAIRDELSVSLRVISELTRGDDGQYDSQPPSRGPAISNTQPTTPWFCCLNGIHLAATRLINDTTISGWWPAESMAPA